MTVVTNKTVKHKLKHAQDVPYKINLFQCLLCQLQLFPIENPGLAHLSPTISTFPSGL